MFLNVTGIIFFKLLSWHCSNHMIVSFEILFLYDFCAIDLSYKNTSPAQFLVPPFFVSRVCEHRQTKHVFLLVDCSPSVQYLSIISNNWSVPSVIQWSNCSLIERCSNLLEPRWWLVIQSGSAWCHISWSKTTPCQYSHAQLSATNSSMSINGHVGQ